MRIKIYIYIFFDISFSPDSSHTSCIAMMIKKYDNLMVLSLAANTQNRIICGFATLSGCKVQGNYMFVLPLDWLLVLSNSIPVTI